MGLGRISPGERGFEERTYECSTCHRIEKVSFPVDPMKTDAVGWLASEAKAVASLLISRCFAAGPKSIRQHAFRRDRGAPNIRREAVVQHAADRLQVRSRHQVHIGTHLRNDLSKLRPS
jgi:hypothetical protein